MKNRGPRRDPWGTPLVTGEKTRREKTRHLSARTIVQKAENEICAMTSKVYQISDKNCSDHSAFGANLEAHKQPQKDLSGMLLALNKVDWVKFNKDILSTPFSPYRYSNVNCLLYQWYNWIKEKIERLVPPVTKHRASQTLDLKGDISNPWLCPKVSTILGHNPEVSTTTTTSKTIHVANQI